MLLDQIRVAIPLACPYEKVVFQDELQDGLNLVVGKGQLAISHLDTVVFQGKMATCDLNAAALAAILSRSKVNSRRHNLTDLRDVQAGAHHARDHRFFEWRRG